MAHPFRFRLQPILDIREDAEQKAKEQLAETIAIRTQGREMLQSAHDLVAAAADSAREAAARPVTIAEMAAQQAWRERLERHRVAAGQQLEQAEGEVRLSRTALVQAHQKRAALDKLKDSKAAAHRAAMERREAAETDEIALRMHSGRARRTA